MAGAVAASLIAAAATTALAGAAPAPSLAPGIEAAKDLAPSSTAYVVTNTTTLYKGPQYDPNGQTGEEVKRGERLQILGEAGMGGFLLVAKGGKGVGYVPRSLVCPVNLCPNVQG